MDYTQELVVLRDKINFNKSDCDLAKSELYHREIRNELLLKREQIPQLRKELQIANGKIFELTKETDKIKSLFKESEFNLQLALRKSTMLEEKMKGINDAYLNLKLKEEMRRSEVLILKDSVQNITYEKHQLIREVEELRDKLKIFQAFQDELEDRQSLINELIVKVKENCENLEKEQIKIIHIDQKLEKSKDFQNLSQQLREENERVAQNYSNLENKLIESTAKYETLKNLFCVQTKLDTQEQNLIDKIKFLQWHDRCRKLEEKNKNNEITLATITETLNKEIETNVLLLQENEEYKLRLEELEKKLIIVKSMKEEPGHVIEINE